MTIRDALRRDLAGERKAIRDYGTRQEQVQGTAVAPTIAHIRKDEQDHARRLTAALKGSPMAAHHAHAAHAAHHDGMREHHAMMAEHHRGAGEHEHAAHHEKLSQHHGHLANLHGKKGKGGESYSEAVRERAGV